MKILVTGAGGFLGVHIVRKLLERGATDMRCLLRDPQKAQPLESIGAAFPDAKLEVQIGNLKSVADCDRATQGIDLIVHAAASMKGGAADMFMDAVVASRNLLEAVARNRVSRIVLISSFGVYGVAGQPRGALLNEQMPLESHPEQRDIYSHAKLRQEQLFWDARARHNFELVVLRPGVVFGPGGGHFSTRVGVNFFGLFLHMGGGNLLPLTYVENCADAIALAALTPGNDGEAYNVVDDDLITCREYLRLYKQNVEKIRSLRLPYPAMQWISRRVQWYHNYSTGQLPAIFTPYKTKTMWGGNRFSNAKLHSIGWTPSVPIKEALTRTFQWLRRQP
jgi:nucleoside-diphosphate-sugar epimerase